MRGGHPVARSDAPDSPHRSVFALAHKPSAMGLHDLFKRPKPNPAVQLPALNIDLGLFSCGHTQLGTKPDARDPFALLFQTQDTINEQSSGLEMGVKDGVLDYAFITLAQSGAHFFRLGSPLPLTTRTTVAEVQSVFGQPYWVDQDPDEVILFYEYQDGDVELQFEFPGRVYLGFITLAAHGILSNPEQRKAYRVTKPWPPRNG